MRKRVLQKEPTTSHSAFQILSLSGGGYRGLFSVIVLEELERRAGRPLRECFDLIAGTSIGGILACGIAAGIPASRMRAEFERLGSGIFESRLRLPFGLSVKLPRFGLIGSKYSRKGLEAAIDGTLGSASTLPVGDLGKPLVVTSVNATNGMPVMFESRTSNGHHGASLRDVALATSAAPTYFPEYNLGGNSLLDGGIVANAPDAVAMIKAISSFGQRPGEIRMLSVGTAGGLQGEVFRDGRSAGALRWMVSRNLFGLTVGAQQELSVTLVREVLGERYLRIDALPDQARSQVIALDRADRTARDTLVGLARQAITDIDRARGADTASFLRHVAASS